MTEQTENPKGMSATQARRLEYSIIGLCLVSLVLIFQPFSMTLFAVGAVLVVVGGLAFNLVPMCVAGNSIKSVIRSGVIVLIIFVVVVLLALGTTELYTIYLNATR